MGNKANIVVESYLEKDATGQLGGQIKLVPNPGRIETVNYAVASYGFLIECNERVSTEVFAQRIEKAYDCVECPQNRAVVEALRGLM